ncbi:MAG: hypothetical protein SV422_01160 [Pseudomonadota bacterium]|nr:hypothetical protein [Pseudomonadota bacterium]
MKQVSHAVRTITRRCVRSMALRLALPFTLLFPFLCCGAQAAESFPTLKDLAHFDGSQNVLTSCVALKNPDGSAQLDANGNARMYDVTLGLERATLTFSLLSAVPVETTTGCSGVFRNGVYSDIVLITNLAPFYDGKLWVITLDYIVDTNLEFLLRRVEPAGTTPEPPEATITFNFAPTTSAEDQQLIRDTVEYARNFLQTVFSRTLQRNATITTLGPIGGCANPGASAFTGPQNLTICTGNHGWTDHGPVTKNKILIHEVFHLLQFELRWLGGPPGSITGPHWLIEGAAEYVGWLGIAARGDVTLGFSLDIAHGCMLKEVADFALRQPPGLPNLNVLESPQNFGNGPVYPLAMIGAKQLIDGSSLAQLLAYGTALASGTAWTTAFTDAFGTTAMDFYAQFPAYKVGLAVPAEYACRI